MGIGTYLQYLKDINSPILKPLNDNGVYLIDPEGTSIKDGDLSFVWDSKTNQITEMDDYDLLQYPVGLQEALRQYYDFNGAIDQYNRAMLAQQIKDNMPQTAQKKKGGVLKAKDGTPVQKLADLDDYDLSKYLSDYDTTTLHGMDASGNLTDKFTSKIAGKQQGRYEASKEDDEALAKTIEENSYYTAFTDALFDKDGKFTPLGEAWAHAVDAELPENSPARFYEADNRTLKTSWQPIGIDARNRKAPTTPFTNVKDYATWLRTDNTIGARHNVYGKQGTRYYWIDAQNKKHYVDPELQKYYDKTGKNGYV